MRDVTETLNVRHLRLDRDSHNKIQLVADPYRSLLLKLFITTISILVTPMSNSSSADVRSQLTRWPVDGAQWVRIAKV